MAKKDKGSITILVTIPISMLREHAKNAGFLPGKKFATRVKDAAADPKSQFSQELADYLQTLFEEDCMSDAAPNYFSEDETGWFIGLEERN